MNKEDKIRYLNNYKKMLEDVKKEKDKKNDYDRLSTHFNNKVNHKVKKLVKVENGFTNYMLPIIVTVFIIGFAVGIAFAIYKF